MAQPFIHVSRAGTFRSLSDAGVFSVRGWALHPLRTALRLIPLRFKQNVNRVTGRPIFDLSFYLQFQPPSLDHLGLKIACTRQAVDAGTKRRVAFVTPHFGPGGAENVLLDMASSLDRRRTEMFAIATHARDRRLAPMWRDRADHVYDLAAGTEPESVSSALCSLIANERMDLLVLQNSLFGYCVIPTVKTLLPGLKVVDVIHTVGTAWDIARVTSGVAAHIDLRIVSTDSVRRHLIALGNSPEKIRLIPTGIDLDRFRPAPRGNANIFRLLFAARLDPVKRPLLLVDIARALARIGPPGTFRFVVTGDGPEQRALRMRIRRAGVGHLFELKGYVADVAPLLAECGALLVTSSNEGIPLAIIEAFATARPVIASRAGAIDEVVTENTGMLIEPGPGEAERFAQAIATLMTTPELATKLGMEARRLAELRYSQKASRRLYREALAEPIECTQIW